MPTIKPSAYLRNNYNEVSEFCNSRTEPVFITKNGHVYHLLDEAHEAENTGSHVGYRDFMTEFRKEMKEISC